MQRPGAEIADVNPTRQREGKLQSILPLTLGDKPKPHFHWCSKSRVMLSSRVDLRSCHAFGRVTVQVTRDCDWSRGLLDMYVRVTLIAIQVRDTMVHVICHA